MIHDCLVVGIKDELLSERLQMESDLMLDNAKTLIRQREAVQKQGILKGNGDTLEAVNTKPKKKFNKPQQKRAPNPNQTMKRQPAPIQAKI